MGGIRDGGDRMTGEVTRRGRQMGEGVTRASAASRRSPASARVMAREK
ncbi:MAG: hypothetical protein AVDCRST_MAG70-1760 [uncultured Thermomicrobiales bacterium]|uniref:Uncharacterized protein n=1 Tax=uncultured Thermomicrobiales bacterium TaxID=1645740 RepID=A0A6J4UX72_9BACT|nr:MAG: hypothetical protein AVDCRST_MAG70-1760 [uncultured Thermomicrobiales bacterium]